MMVSLAKSTDSHILIIVFHPKKVPNIRSGSFLCHDSHEQHKVVRHFFKKKVATFFSKKWVTSLDGIMILKNAYGIKTGITKIPLITNNTDIPPSPTTRERLFLLQVNICNGTLSLYRHDLTMAPLKGNVTLTNYSPIS